MGDLMSAHFFLPDEFGVDDRQATTNESRLLRSSTSRHLIFTTKSTHPTAYENYNCTTQLRIITICIDAHVSHEYDHATAANLQGAMRFAPHPE
jgi:hypothetical protein